MRNPLRILVEWLNSLDDVDPHEECYTQSYRCFDLEKTRPKIDIPYKVEPKKHKPIDNEIDEYDCTRTE